MSRTKVPIKVENHGDLILVEKGYLSSDKVRQIEVEALVDTGSVPRKPLPW